MNLVIIQARMSSSRLPGKNMMKLHRANMIDYVLNGATRAELVDKVVIALPDEDNISPIKNKYSKYAFVCEGVPVSDVLSRYYHTINRLNLKPDNVIRLTSDCPLLNFFHKEIDRIIHYHIKNDNDYTYNRGIGGSPSGLDVEVMKYNALKSSFDFAGKDMREHVTTWIRNNPSVFKIQDVPAPFNFKCKWSIDTLEDFKKVEDVIKLLEMRSIYENR